jgi:hypothetical protein
MSAILTEFPPPCPQFPQTGRYWFLPYPIQLIIHSFIGCIVTCAVAKASFREVNEYRALWSKQSWPVLRYLITDSLEWLTVVREHKVSQIMSNMRCAKCVYNCDRLMPNGSQPVSLRKLHIMGIGYCNKLEAYSRKTCEVWHGTGLIL